jgi:hypothetical protein
MYVMNQMQDKIAAEGQSINSLKMWQSSDIRELIEQIKMAYLK